MQDIKLMGVSCTIKGISNYPEKVYRSIFIKFGAEFKTVKRARNGKSKADRHKNADKIIQVVKNKVLYDIVDRREISGNGITQYTKNARKAQGDMIVTGGKGTSWTPITLNKTTHKRISANIVINIKTNAPAQLFAKPDDALKPNQNPTIYPKPRK